MLKQHWKWTLAVLVVLGISVSLIFLQNKSSHESAKTSTENDVQKSTETTTPPAKETKQSKHQYGDGWHAEPHESIEVAEVETELSTPPTELTEVQGGTDTGQQVNAQPPVPVQEFSQLTQEAREAYKTWNAWEKKDKK